MCMCMESATAGIWACLLHFPEWENFTFPGSNFYDTVSQGTPSITPTRTNTKVHADVQVFDRKPRRNEMKTILAAIALSLFSLVAFADYGLDKSADEVHLEEHGS